MAYSLNGLAQFDNQVLFPTIDGSELIEKLVDNYKPNNVLDYSIARDTLFSKIYGINDSLSCVYTGHRLYMNPNEDPTETVYLDGINDGINTEHTYPQSKGAEFGNAKSDMHHLYPTRLKVNSTRGSKPFGEINDSSTDSWFLNNNQQNNIPGNNIDLYSESSGTLFEPREDHKGNVARAMFYFYTMYQDQADAADPEYFDIQLGDLCDWHYLDPVDEKEWVRSMQIASYQQDKANPFVLDCTLAGRSYCDFISEGCKLVDTDDQIAALSEFNIYPNPVNLELFIEANENLNGGYEYLIFDLQGQLIIKSTLANQQKTKIDVSNLQQGIYFIKINAPTNHELGSKFFKFIK